PSQGEHQKGVEDMQEKIDQAEPQRFQPVDDAIEGEGQDRDRPVEVGNLHVRGGPVPRTEDEAPLTQVAGQIVLLDDPMVVVDEGGAEGPEIDQNPAQDERQDGAPWCDHGFLEPTYPRERRLSSSSGGRGGSSLSLRPGSAASRSSRARRRGSSACGSLPLRFVVSPGSDSRS